MLARLARNSIGLGYLPILAKVGKQDVDKGLQLGRPDVTEWYVEDGEVQCWRS